MYVYLYLVAYSHLFPTCTVHNLYMEISRHFIFRNFIYSPHPHPTPYPPPPPPKKNPRRTKNIHLCNWFFWFSLNQENKNCIPLSVVFFSSNLMFWNLHININRRKNYHIYKKKIKNGNLGMKLFRKWPSIPILCTDVNFAINLWKELLTLITQFVRQKWSKIYCILWEL